MSEITNKPIDRALDRLLTEGDVRGVIKCGHSTYYKLITGGQLRSVTVGRRRYVRESDLADFIAGLPA